MPLTRTHRHSAPRRSIFSTRRRAPARTHRQTVTTTTTTTKPRRRGMFGGAGRRTHGTTAARAPVHHHQRRPSVKDKVSGALLKLKGSLTRRPGVKAAGTRRMHGTDGRGARHSVRRY
ncbi:hypothetical protein ACHAPJ_005386 [Fusarium lateritium]